MNHRNAAKFKNFARWYGLLLLALSTISTVKAQTEICQPRPADIVFVLDGSRSVRPWHFKSTTDAVKDMVDEFDALGADSIQIGLIQYGSLVKQEFALGQYNTKEEVNEAIDGITYMAGGTMTGAALRYLVTRTFTKQEGARMSPQVAKIAVIITDGRAQDADGVEIWHQKVKEAGIEIFAIGVGRRIQDADLLLMASEPKEKHKFNVQNFDLIQNLHLLLKDEICVIEVDECAEETDGCDHICTNTIGSYFCECRSGYELQEDDKTCQYYDPCENAGCQHTCETKPSRGFRCMCRDGYVLNRDKRTCSAKKPASLVNLEFSDIDHDSMRVRWELDEPERASSVEYYTVKYEHGVTGEVRQKKVYEPEAVLDDLTPGTEYTVSVKSHGDGLESAPISGKETTLFLGDTRVAVSHPSLTSLFATWDPAGGDLLSGYKVQVMKIEKDGEYSEISNHDVSNEQHEMEIDGLTAGQSYRVIVTPMHGKLLGGAGSDDGTTLSLKEPDVLVTDTTYRSAVVEWTGIGGPADYFLVTLFSNSVDGELQQNVSGNSHSTVFTGLNPATEYTALVSGHVGEFSSADGTARGRTKNPETPSVSVTDTGLTTMDVIWTISGRYPDKFEVEWYPTGDSANKKSVVTEDISLNLKDLQVGTEYEVNVVAVYLEESPIKSSKGSTTASTKYPLPPVVRITNTGLTTLNAEWSVDEIQPSSYRVDIIDTKRSNVKSLETANTSLTFTNLIPEREYRVEVRGTYNTKSELIGEVISEPGTDTDMTKIPPPPEVELVGTGLGTLEVSWTYDALEVDDFVVALENAGLGVNEVKNTTEYSHKFTGLEPGTKYQVGVFARYMAGWVPESLSTIDESVAGVTMALEAPIVTADALSWTTGTVNWTGIGMPAAQFKVEYFYDGADPMSDEVNGSFNTATLTDLDQNKDYVVTVTGIVEEDGRTFISPTGHDTFSIRAVPEPEVDITSTGLTTVQVSWTPSSSSHLSKPTEYQVTYFPTNDPRDSQTFNTEETSASLTGLEPGTEYTVEVVASYHDPYLHGTYFESAPGRDLDTTKSLSAPDVEATVTSSTTAQIDWTSNIGYEVASWRIEYTPKESESPPMVEEVLGHITSIDLADLVRDAEYDVSVYGIAQESGMNHTSPPGVDDFVMKTHSPPNVKITKTGLQIMHVSWTIEGKYPSRFIGRYYPTNDPDNSESFTTEDISYKLTGLDQDTNYTVEVTSVYTEEDITVTTDPGSDTNKTKRLHAPNVTTTGSTYTTADIEWTGIGMPADLYEVKYKPTDSDEEALELRVVGDTQNWTLTGLQHDTDYIVTVKGVVTEDGEPFWSPVGEDNFKLVDLPPPEVAVIGSTATTLNATWETDVDADSFIVTIRGQDDGSIQRFNFEGDVREHTFDSLTPGAKYIIVVRTRVTENEKETFRVNEIISSVGTAKGNTKPGPPQNLKDASGKPTDITVSFDPPSGSYDYFEYMCVPDGTDVAEVPISRINADASLQAVCLDVGPGVRYTVYIRTRTGDDVSDWATLDVQTTFGPPQNFTLSEPTTHTIVATWEPPEYVDTVDVYVLSYKPADTNEPTTEVEILGTETKYVIENLHPSTSYRGSIIAVVRSFKSPATEDSETTLDDDVSVSVVDTGYNTIEIEWPGSRVNGVVYALFYKPNPDFTTEISGSTITLDPETTSAVIPDLTPATIYDIQLQYVYSTGPAAEATTSGATLAPPPGPLTFTDVANTEFVVHWEKPGFGAEPIGYIVTYVGPEPGEIVTQPDGGDTLEWKFDSMHPGTTYNVSVIARYQNGIESEPVHGQVTTRPREQRQQCSCNDYMDRQNDMQRTVEKLVGVIEVLTARIGSLEELLTAPALPEFIERSPPVEQ